MYNLLADDLFTQRAISDREGPARVYVLTAGNVDTAPVRYNTRVVVSQYYYYYY